jgi:hypothetical protein
MAVPKKYMKRFNAAMELFKLDPSMLGILETECIHTGEPRYVISVAIRKDDGTTDIYPLAEMLDENGTDRYVTPENSIVMEAESD